jgi:TolB protein
MAMHTVRKIGPVRAALLLVGALLAAAAVRAELRIEINRGTLKAQPIAVVPFGGAAPLDVAAVVAADLERSGRFEPMARDDMLQRPTSGAEVDFGSWRIQKVDVLVVGRVVEAAPGQFEIQFQLFDVLKGEQLLGYRQASTAADLRRNAHRVADIIYEKLTGIRGIFATRIAYVTAQRSPGRNVYRLIVADADGENARTMAESAEPIMSPAWSPDGRKIAYVSFESQRAEIYVQELRSGARQRVSARPGVNGAPAWSPDGRLLAVSLSRPDGNLDIYTLDVATQVLTRLTDGPAIDTEPAFSPDGTFIYFTSDGSGGPQVYRVPVEGGRAVRVTFEGRYNARPRPSPDGRLIAVVHNDRGAYRIATVDPARGVTQVLSDGRLDESPAFAPNGETLIYATREGTRGVLATVSVDGRIKQRISVTEGDVREPAWSPFPAN